MADVVEKIFSSAEHPGLTSASFPDVVADLRPLYEAEPDPLLWFERATPIRAAEATVRAVAAAADDGLNPDDYDVPLLLEQWRAVRTGSARQQNTRFSTLASASPEPVSEGVHNGCVDPATMNWGYTIERKPVVRTRS